MNSQEYEQEINRTTQGFNAGASAGHAYALAYAVFYGLRIIASALVRVAQIKKE